MYLSKLEIFIFIAILAITVLTLGYMINDGSLIITLKDKSKISKKNKKSKKKKKLKIVDTMITKKSTIVDYLETTGDIITTNMVTIQATIEGPISYCPWREGDLIKESEQKLIEINRPLYRQETIAAKTYLSIAKAKLNDLKAGVRPEKIAQARESIKQLEDCTKFTKTDLDRIMKLVNSGSLSMESQEKARVSYIKCKTKLMTAKQQLSMFKSGPTRTEIAIQQANVENAEAKLTVAQAKFDECIILSPFSGIITKVFVHKGDLAKPRTPLLEMIDPQSLVVRFAVPETSSMEIINGVELNIYLDAYPNICFKAKIVRIYPEIKWTTRTRIVEAKVIEDVKLVPGMFVRVALPIKTAHNAIVVPDNSISTTPRGDKIVYVIENGIAKKRIVLLGLEYKGDVQIANGVSENETVVISGNEKLNDGTKVKMLKKASAKTDEKVGNK